MVCVCIVLHQLLSDVLVQGHIHVHVHHLLKLLLVLVCLFLGALVPGLSFGVLNGLLERLLT